MKKIIVLSSLFFLVAVFVHAKPRKVSSPSGKDTLAAGNQMTANQYLVSPNGQYRLSFQEDGNLVLMDEAGAVLWSTGTQGKGGAYVKLELTGNLGVYSRSGKALWTSKTAGSGAVKLVMQDSGYIELQKADGSVVWKKTDSRAGDHIREVKAHYIAMGKKEAQVSINAIPEDIVIIIIGGSNGGSSETGRSTLLGGSEMPNQGFKLIRMVGDDDSKIEAWAKIWDKGNSVLIPEHAHAVGYSITVFKGSKVRVNPRYLSDGKIATENGLVKGLTRVKAQDGRLLKDNMKLPLKVGGSGTTLVGIFFDDPCLNLEVIDGNRDVPIYGFKDNFGDGDSFGLLVMEGDQVNNLAMAIPPRNALMTDHSTITINVEGWLIYK